MSGHTPAPRALRIVRTATGIGIGSAYVQPPAPPSRDAEAIQRALLAAPHAHRPPRGATLIAALLAALSITACGGGGDADHGQPDKAINPPDCAASGVCI